VRTGLAEAGLPTKHLHEKVFEFCPAVVNTHRESLLTEGSHLEIDADRKRSETKLWGFLWRVPNDVHRDQHFPRDNRWDRNPSVLPTRKRGVFVWFVAADRSVN
jgi:hypothetical protein